MVYVYLSFPIPSNSWGSGMMNHWIKLCWLQQKARRAFLVRLRSSPQSSSTANSAATRTWRVKLPFGKGDCLDNCRPKMSWPSCDFVVCSSQMQQNINLSKKMHCAVHMSKNQNGFMNWIEFMHQIHCSKRVQTIQSTCTHMQSAPHSALYLHTYRISYLSFHLHQIIVYWIVCIKWHLSISINQCLSSSSSYMRKVDQYINRHLLIIFDFPKLSIYIYQYHIHHPIKSHQCTSITYPLVL